MAGSLAEASTVVAWAAEASMAAAAVAADGKNQLRHTTKMAGACRSGHFLSYFGSVLSYCEINHKSHKIVYYVDIGWVQSLTPPPSLLKARGK